MVIQPWAASPTPMSRARTASTTASPILVFGRQASHLPSARGCRGWSRFSKQREILSSGSNPRSIMKTLVIVLSCLAASLAASHGTPFSNLGFESVSPPLMPNDPQGYGRVPLSSALPGWPAFAGLTPIELVLTNGMFFDSAGVSLYGPGGGRVIEGNYTAFFQSGFPLFNPTGQISAAIAQIGQVPSDAQSILLKAQVLFGPFSVRLGSQDLSMTPLSVGPNYTLYGANIPGMAGQTEELRITAYNQPDAPGFMHTWLWVDSISFSPDIVVPEPSVVALLLCGGLLFGLSIWRKQPKP
jgi:hypothetical protein